MKKEQHPMCQIDRSRDRKGDTKTESLSPVSLLKVQ
jgi:hypothetical protein